MDTGQHCPNTKKRESGRLQQLEGGYITLNTSKVFCMRKVVMMRITEVVDEVLRKEQAGFTPGRVWLAIRFKIMTWYTWVFCRVYLLRSLVIMGFYPTYMAIFNAYTRSKLAYIRGLQGPIYTRAKMRVYVIT